MDNETGRGERRAGWPEQLCCVVSHSCPMRGSCEEQKGCQKGHRGTDVQD